MLFEDTYKTIFNPSEGIFRDKGSKFIAYLHPIRSEEEAKQIVSEIKGQHPKARHHCWALRLSPDRSVFRINDDGEPSGTAGRPILNTLLSHELTNVILVVVRYFGGTLLGVPGLINAYKTASLDAIVSATIVDKTINEIYLLEFDYLEMNDVMRLIKEEDLHSFDQQFDNNCSLKIEVRRNQVNLILGKLGKMANVKSKYLATR